MLHDSDAGSPTDIARDVVHFSKTLFAVQLGTRWYIYARIGDDVHLALPGCFKHKPIANHSTGSILTINEQFIREWQVLL